MLAKIRNKNNLCIIPARKGSKGIKNKNTKILHGIPLIEHTLKYAKKIDKSFDVLVSTDSPKIKKLSRKYRFICDQLRPKRLSNDSALTIDVVKYEISRLEKKFKKIYKFILLLQPTVPYRTINDLKISLKKIKSGKFDSVVSIKDVDGYHPLRMKIIKNNILVNYNLEKKENMSPRQLLPKVFIRSGSIYLIKRNVLFNKDSLVGKRVYGLIQKKKFTINIDNKKDFILAENT